ncbi:MAG: preprotein translocase subunit YajC [Anaerolineae bacterium]
MDQNWLFWIIAIAALVVFLILPQWLARRRQRKREEELQVGDDVMTIGGLIGTLTHLDFEHNIARLEIAEGVEVRLLPGAISGKRVEATAQGETEGAQEEELG